MSDNIFISWDGIKKQNNHQSGDVMISMKDFNQSFQQFSKGKELMHLNNSFNNFYLKEEENIMESTEKPEIQILGVGKRGPLDMKLERQLVRWIKQETHLETPNSHSVRQKAAQLFKERYPDFKASRGWYYNFLKRHKIRRFKSTIIL